MSTTILATYPQITYNPPGNWDSFGSSKSTFHSGSSASLSFTGSQVDIFGSVLKKSANLHGPSAAFIVDSEIIVSQQFHRINQFQNNILLFSHTFPPPFDFHTLNITSEKEGGFLILNSIVVSNFTQTTSNSHSSSSSSNSLTTSGLFPEPSSISSPPALGSTSTSKANITGRIVGGVIAGIVVLACLVAFLLYRRRKRMRAARRASPFAVTPFTTEFSKPSSPEPLKSIPTTGAVPTLPFASPPIITELDRGDESPPAFVAGPSDLGRHGSMYKPRQSVDSLPPTEFGYGGGMSREEWARYTLKSKS